MRRTVIALCLMAVACGADYPCPDPIQLPGSSELACYVDPPITLNQQGAVPPVEGPPEVFLGHSSLAAFTPMQAGDELAAFEAIQNGVWAHVAIRVVGIGSPARVECSLTLRSTGEVTGFVNSKNNLYPTDDGTLELASMGIPFMEDSDGQWRLLITGPTVLWCTAEDDQGRSAERSVDVVVVAT